MYANSGGFRINIREKSRKTSWQPDENAKLFETGKCFVRCICPKCSELHSVYMLWTGRGVPRKYCGNCKPLVSTYDDAAFYEASISTPGHSKKKGRRAEGE